MLRKLDQLIILFAAVVITVCSTTTTEGAKPNVTHIQFYMHDVVGGSNPTAVRVAGRISNHTGSSPIAATFGSVYVMDNPLTATPDPNSTLVGRAQGIYAMSSQHNEFSVLMTLTYVFAADGPYNGSTLSVVGRNPVMDEVREMPVVGGTGLFRLARGYCFARTHSTDQMDAIIGYNVTLLHYYNSKAI
ncbi:Disease resistance response protein [Trema orientale]|uniref:Dirigent protein n=1 Tax=Trema orientale TaxID=63057 RepID=A0A2P5EBS2_TREOI|nr:Disease resistance response protein [Trema orientale]